MIPAPYFYLDGDTGALWCRNDGQDEEGRTRFWVINGHWHGDYKDGVVRIEYTGESRPATVTWMGSVPFDYEDYNEAMEFIRGLNWRIEMNDKKTTFNEMLTQQQNAEHNSRVMNLAKAFADAQKEVERQREGLRKNEERLVEIEKFAQVQSNFDDTEKYNEIIKLLPGSEFSYRNGGR